MFFATARAGTVCVGGGGADELVIVLAYQVTITELKTVIKSMLMKSILLWPCLLSQKIRSRTITRKARMSLSFCPISRGLVSLPPPRRVYGLCLKLKNEHVCACT